jgi:hypothetical protein
MEILNNIQDIVFENSENLKNNAYINLQNELMKLYDELKDNDMQKHIDLLLHCKKLEDKIKMLDNIIEGNDFNITSGFWRCHYCYNKEGYTEIIVCYIYNYYNSAVISQIGYLNKIKCCHKCYGSKLIKTDYKISGITFCMSPKVYLKNNIPELEDIQYQYLNRKYLDLCVIIGTGRRSKEKLEDIQKHFGIIIKDISDNSFDKDISKDLLRGALLSFREKYIESFNVEDDYGTESVTVEIKNI